MPVPLVFVVPFFCYFLSSRNSFYLGFDAIVQSEGQPPHQANSTLEETAFGSRLPLKRKTEFEVSKTVKRFSVP